MMTLSALILSLPTRNSTVRMRVWRALKESGCAVLRDGVYVTPSDARRDAVLARVEAEVRSVGGSALTAELRLTQDPDGAQVRALFDRSAQYGVLVAAIAKAQASLRGLGPRKARTAVLRLQRKFDELAQVDFFPGEAKRQTHNALTRLQQTLAEIDSPDEPRASKHRVQRRAPDKYRRRVWATRSDPWVDRLASAWLIKRFIDRDGRIVWIDRLRDRPAKAVGFDFDGAEFTHAGGRVTFEVLLASFGLESDPGLAAIGAAVHFLDVGGIPVADAKGLETVLRGVKEKARSDDALLAEAMRILDLFYAAYAQPVTA